MYCKLLLLLPLMNMPLLFSCQPPNPHVDPATMTIDQDGREDSVWKIQMRKQHERKIQGKKHYHNKNNMRREIRAEKVIAILAHNAQKIKKQQLASTER